MRILSEKTNNENFILTFDFDNEEIVAINQNNGKKLSLPNDDVSTFEIYESGLFIIRDDSVYSHYLFFTNDGTIISRTLPQVNSTKVEICDKGMLIRLGKGNYSTYFSKYYFFTYDRQVICSDYKSDFKEKVKAITELEQNF